MPGMDGFELCRQMKGDSALSRIPFIFLTATYADERDKTLAMMLGAARYLFKPMEPEPLLKVVRQVMAESQETLSEPHADNHTQAEMLEQHRNVLARKLESKVAQLKNRNNS